ncbi:MAG: hypothetical protein LAO78_18875 [Acidobacteriia bacterium]|nr:hypothetical protein [Terriglobia bacterium]
MTENPDDTKLEAYLRRFRPQSPRPLPGRTRVALLRWRVPLMAAAAAVLVFSISLAFFLRKPDHSPVAQIERAEPLAQETSFIRLSRAAMDDTGGFDARMDSLSAKLLPDVRRSQGILKALAHE